MEDLSQRQEPEGSPSGSSGGLYKNVKIGTRTLDIVIIGLVAIIVICTLIGVIHPGYLVQFDSRGGSDVEAVRLQYGDAIPEPVPPAREGYAFAGWFSDSNCYDPWDFASMTVSGSMTLYAGWEAAG